MINCDYVKLDPCVEAGTDAAAHHSWLRKTRERGAEEEEPSPLSEPVQELWVMNLCAFGGTLFLLLRL